MISMTDYLKNWREEMPSWLAEYHPGDQVAFSDFISGRIGYYPGSLFDGCLIETANIAHCVHSFLYVDYGVTREQVEEELSKKDTIRGYHSIGRVEWSHKDLMPQGDYQLPIDLLTCVKDSGVFVAKNVQPFCIMEVYERNQDKDESCGAERIAVTYLFADGIATYYQLFVMQYKKAPWLFLLQDHGFGGNYDRFGKGGLLHAIISNYRLRPKFVISGENDANMWDGYHRILDVESVVGGMHHDTRVIYAKNDQETT